MGQSLDLTTTLDFKLTGQRLGFVELQKFSKGESTDTEGKFQRQNVTLAEIGPFGAQISTYRSIQRERWEICSLVS